jgi:apolipoprotein D and lipocalin family protein
MEVVSSVDLERYLGKWYEIARKDNRFQKGCINSTAEYSFRDDGDIRVLNQCEVPGKDNKSAVGRAWVKDSETNAKLKVTFVLKGLKLGFLSGDYWILDLGEDYDYALIGEPDRKYLWILSRTPTIPEDLKINLLSKARSMGYDLSDLIENQPEE